MTGSMDERNSSLEGKSVVNTRSPRQAQELDLLLLERGARPLSYPCIDIAGPLDPAPLDGSLKLVAAGAYDWVVFTSANAVEAVAARLKGLALPAQKMAQARMAVVGPGTAAAVTRMLGITPDLSAEDHVAEVLAGELIAHGARRVLVPQADQARAALSRLLEENGTQVDAVTAYRTVRGAGGVDLPSLLRAGRVDAVVFASASAVDNMAVRFQRENGDWDDLREVCLACIGPFTAAAVKRRGLQAQVVALDHTILGVVDAIADFFREHREHKENNAVNAGEVGGEETTGAKSCWAGSTLIQNDHSGPLRLRRLRFSSGMRALVRETNVLASDLIYPLFVRPGIGVKRPIVSMPGQFQWSPDAVVEEAAAAAERGVPAVILFGIPEAKDRYGSGNLDPDGPVPSAIRALKKELPDLVLISDMCFCEYTDHGHCGVANLVGLPEYRADLPEGYVLNDPTLELLGRASVAHAMAGADAIAPSGMIDGMVGSIRRALDGAGKEHTTIMSYAAKYASAFYGPFRDAAESPPSLVTGRSTKWIRRIGARPFER